MRKGPLFLHADIEDSDQIGPIPRLIRVFAGRTCHFVVFCHATAHLLLISGLESHSIANWMCLPYNGHGGPAENTFSSCSTTTSVSGIIPANCVYFEREKIMKIWNLC